MTRAPNADSTDSRTDAAADAATDSAEVGRGVPWRYLVAPPTAEIPVAGLALASSETLGPSHAATAALGLFLVYATPVVGALSFVGLILDGRSLDSRNEEGARWRWYAGTALAIAAVLTYHGTEEGAPFGLREPTVALALATVPVGAAYFVRRAVV